MENNHSCISLWILRKRSVPHLRQSPPRYRSSRPPSRHSAWSGVIHIPAEWNLKWLVISLVARSEPLSYLGDLPNGPCLSHCEGVPGRSTNSLQHQPDLWCSKVWISKLGA